MVTKFDLPEDDHTTPGKEPAVKSDPVSIQINHNEENFHHEKYLFNKLENVPGYIIDLANEIESDE